MVYLPRTSTVNVLTSNKLIAPSLNGGGAHKQAFVRVPFRVVRRQEPDVSRKNLIYTALVAAGVYVAMSKYGGHLGGQRHGS